MFRTIIKHRICGIIEIEVYKFDGKLIFIKRCHDEREVSLVLNRIKDVSLKIAI